MSEMYDDVRTYDLTVSQDAGHDLSNFKTTSAKIRYLDSTGMKRAQIAKVLNIRYQHVKNVLDQPLKRG